MALVCGLALFSALSPIPTLAEPAPSGPALTWEGPATCPPGDLMDRVATLVGLRRDELESKRLRVDGVVSQGASGTWQAQLRIETSLGWGERSFSAEDCGSLLQGAALITALAVAPEAAALHAPNASPSPDAAARSSPTRARTETSMRPAFVLRPWLSADRGLLPNVSLSYGGAVGVTWPHLRFEIEGSHQGPQTVSDHRGHSGRVQTPLTSGLRACGAPWQLPSIEPAACLGTALTWLRTTGGPELALPETHHTLAVALTGGVALGWRLTPWLWLRAEGSLGLTVRRPTLQVLTANQDATDVYSVRGLTTRLAGGVEFRI